MAGGVLAHGLLSPGGSSPLRPGTVRPSLPPSSLPRRPFGSPCGVRSLGGDSGLTTFRRRPALGETPPLRRGLECLRQAGPGTPAPATDLLVQAWQPLWLVVSPGG